MKGKLFHLFYRCFLIILLILPWVAVNVQKVMAAPLLVPPSNDEFNSATVIGSIPFIDSIPGAATTATPKAGDPANGDPQISCIHLLTGLATVWYKYTAPAEGILKVDTLFSGYDTVAAVWTGTWGNLTLISCNDDAYPATSNAITQAHLLNGNTYYIEIALAGGTSGLNIQSSGDVAAASADDLVLEVNFTATSGGTYDDSHSNWVYSSGWTAYTGSGPYNNTMHYTSTPGSYAELTFSGTNFILTLQRNTNRGLIDVYVDDVLLDTINPNGPLMWQWTWTSPPLAPGVHTVRFEFAGGGTYMDIDAIKIDGLLPPLLPGTYDNNHAAWTYSGTWNSYSGSGPYNNTMHYTSTAGSSAELMFDGAKFVLTLQRNTNRGLFNVYVDDVLLDTINPNGPLMWKWTWTSPPLDPGVHTVRFEFAGGGTYIDIDAIQIIPPPTPLGAGTYDDTHSAWSYSSGWTAFTGSGPYNRTMHYTSTQGSTAELLFNGAKFILTLQRNTNRGLIDVYVDDVLLDTINPNGPLMWQWTWTSPALTPGDHTVQFVFAGGGTYIDIDAIQIIPAPTPLEAGTYDDAHYAWQYSSGWTAYTGSGPYNNTMHYTSTPGSSAELLFNGAKFILTLQRNTNRGLIDVYVDDILLDTINPNGPLMWKWTWTSPALTPGVHTVRFEFAGSGTYIDIDAIQIIPAPTPLEAGTYDDAHYAWQYSSGWTAWTGSGPYNNTMHYTSTQGSTAELLFNGAKFILTLQRNTNRGLIDVYVDDVLLDTINPNGPLMWKWTWTSPELDPSDHTVRFEFAGSGTYIDIDAIQIIP